MPGVSFSIAASSTISGGDDCVLEQHPLQQLAAEGEIVACCHEGFFYAMDTYREYLLLNEMWYSGKAPWKVWSQ